MNTRHSRKGRRAVAAVTLTAGLVLTVAGCGGEGDSAGSEKPSASTSTPGEGQQQDKEPSSPGPGNGGDLATSQDGDISVTIKSAERDAGGFVTIAGQLQNNGSSSWLGANWQSEETELAGNGGSMSGASLVDPAAKKKYLVLRDTSGRCLCTKFERVRPGDTADWYAQFPAPPQGSNKVTFQIGSMPPVSIDVSEGE